MGQGRVKDSSRHSKGPRRREQPLLRNAAATMTTRQPKLGVRRMVSDLVDFPGADARSPASRKTRDANPSYDNVADFATNFTVQPAAETTLPSTDEFAAHPGCQRNLSYEALRDEVLNRGEGRV